MRGGGFNREGGGIKPECDFNADSTPGCQPSKWPRPVAAKSDKSSAVMRDIFRQLPTKAWSRFAVFFPSPIVAWFVPRMLEGDGV